MFRDDALRVQRYLQHGLVGRGIDVSLKKGSKDKNYVELLPCGEKNGIVQIDVKNYDNDLYVGEQKITFLATGGRFAWLPFLYAYRPTSKPKIVQEFVDRVGVEKDNTGWEEFVVQLVTSQRLCAVYDCGTFKIRRQISYTEDPIVEVSRVIVDGEIRSHCGDRYGLPFGDYICIRYSVYGDRKGTKSLPRYAKFGEENRVCIDDGLDFDELRDKLLTVIRDSFAELPARF